MVNVGGALGCARKINHGRQGRASVIKAIRGSYYISVLRLEKETVIIPINGNYYSSKRDERINEEVRGNDCQFTRRQEPQVRIWKDFEATPKIERERKHNVHGHSAASKESC